MGKIRDTYGLFSAANLKSRSSIPAATDITVNTSSIDCVNIKVSDVKNVLSASTYSLYDLCRHTNVNRWSAWCPVVRTYSGSFPNNDIVNSVPTICRLGDFAGYNHNALTLGWQSGGQASAQEDIWIDSGNQATVSAPICIGEIDWVKEGAGWVVMLIYGDAEGLVGWGKTDISTVANNFTLTGTTDVSGGIVLSKTWYGRMFICAAGTLASKEDVEAASMCRIPNTTTFSINVKVRAVTDLTVNSNGLTVEGEGFNLIAGTCGFTKFYHLTESYSNVLVQARLFDHLWQQVGSTIDMHDGEYYASDEAFPNITGSAKPNGDYIAAYGYHFVIDFYLTI